MQCPLPRWSGQSRGCFDRCGSARSAGCARHRGNSRPGGCRPSHYVIKSLGPVAILHTRVPHCFDKDQGHNHKNQCAATKPACRQASATSIWALPWLLEHQRTDRPHAGIGGFLASGLTGSGSSLGSNCPAPSSPTILRSSTMSLPRRNVLTGQPVTTNPS